MHELPMTQQSHANFLSGTRRAIADILTPHCPLLLVSTPPSPNLSPSPLSLPPSYPPSPLPPPSFIFPTVSPSALQPARLG